MAPYKQYKIIYKFSAVQKHGRRRSVSVVRPSGRLHTEHARVPSADGGVPATRAPGHRHVRQPVQSEAREVLFSLPPSRCHSRGRVALPPSQGTPLSSSPPWSVIGEWLVRLRDNPHVVSLTIVPFWASAHWFPLLTALHVPRTPVVKVRPRWGLFGDSHGRPMKRPRTPLLCILLSGSCYKTGACRRFKFVHI